MTLQSRISDLATRIATEVKAVRAEVVAALSLKQSTSAKGTANGYASLDGSTKVPIAQVPTGQTSSTVPLGNDARFTDARTPTAHKTTHATGGSDVLTPSDIGAQPVDADLTTIAGLTATTDNIIQSVGSAWASRTPAQVKTALALNNVDNTTDLNKPTSSAAKLYVQSRLQNLFTNGSGLVATDYNMTTFDFDPVETHGGAGSFKYVGGQLVAKSDEHIPVNPDQYYRLAGWAKAGNADGSAFDSANRQYLGVVCCDADFNAIEPYHFMKAAGSTDTTLAVQLSPGATTVTLTDATGWHNGSTVHERNFMWYPYTNLLGFTYPDYGYTRNMASNYVADWIANGVWAAGGISGNVITLRQAWTGPTLAAGTKVRNASSGSSFKYISAGNVVVPNAWTRYEGFIGTLSASNSANTFSPGTAYVRLVFLLNYPPTVSTNIIRWSDLWFSEMSTRNLEAATASVPGVVTLGTGSTQAAAGNDSRIVNAVQATWPDAKGDIYGASADNAPVRVPVGTNGHVLTADSTASAGVRWVSQSGVVGVRLRSGDYIGPVGAFRSTFQMAASVEYAMPIWIVGHGTLDRLGVEVTIAGTAGTLIRLGIRGDDGSTRPGSVLLDAGTVAGDAITAGVELTVSLAVTPGLHWFTATAQSTGATLPTLRAESGDLAPISLGSLTGSLSGSARVAYTTSATVTGALPGTYPISSTTGAAPRIVARVA
jgi:hypothetical protein